jgi:hypothetical protein
MNSLKVRPRLVARAPDACFRTRCPQGDRPAGLPGLLHVCPHLPVEGVCHLPESLSVLLAQGQLQRGSEPEVMTVTQGGERLQVVKHIGDVAQRVPELEPAPVRPGIEGASISTATPSSIPLDCTTSARMSSRGAYLNANGPDPLRPRGDASESEQSEGRFPRLAVAAGSEQECDSIGRYSSR